MYIKPPQINPTHILAGAIAVYEGAWPEYNKTIEDFVSVSIDPSSHFKFIPAQTKADLASGHPLKQSIRTNYVLPISTAAKNNETLRKINNQCYEVVASAVQSYKNIFKIEEEIKDDEIYALLRYSVGERYDQHYDGGTESSRSISVLIYLNDDYDGGEIEFPYFNLKIKPKAGTLILFPSNYAYSHIAHPVISGTKYVIITFLKDR